MSQYLRMYDAASFFEKVYEAVAGLPSSKGVTLPNQALERRAIECELSNYNGE